MRTETKNTKKVLKKKAFINRTLTTLLTFLVTISATAIAAGTSHPQNASGVSKSTAPPANQKPVKKDGAGPSAKPNANKAIDGKESPKEKEARAKEIEASLASATLIDPLSLLQQPTQYMNKKVTFKGTFNRFADIALDYKKAFRDSRDYVTFFILRPDVADHTIPLAELKLFFPRKKSNEVMDMETGDKIQIVGTEFSTALDEPWIDVEHIKILEKTEKHEKNHKPEF